MSSDSACSTRSTRGATKVPDPRRCTSWPDRTSACTALRTVTRLRPVSAAISRSGGRPSPGVSAPASIAAGDAPAELQVERPAAVVAKRLAARTARSRQPPRHAPARRRAPVPLRRADQPGVARRQPPGEHLARARPESRPAPARPPAAGRSPPRHAASASRTTAARRRVARRLGREDARRVAGEVRRAAPSGRRPRSPPARPARPAPSRRIGVAVGAARHARAAPPRAAPGPCARRCPGRRAGTPSRRSSAPRPPRCTPKTEPVPSAAVMPSASPSAPFSAITASLSIRARANGSRAASRAAASGTLAPGEAEHRAQLAELRRRPPPPAPPAPRARMFARAPSGSVQMFADAALAAAEHPPVRVGDRRAAPRASPVDPQIQPWRLPSRARYQTNTKREAKPAYRRIFADGNFLWTIGIVLASSPQRGNRHGRRPDRSAARARQGLQAQPPATVLARLLDGQRARRGAGRARAPGARGRGRSGRRGARRRAPRRLRRRRQLGADGARRRAGARRHLRHPGRRGPRCSSPAARRRCSTMTGAVEDEADERRRRLAAAGPRRRRRRDLRLRQRHHPLHRSPSPRPPAPPAPPSSASPTSPAARCSRSPTSPSCSTPARSWWPARPGMGAATAQKIALNMISTLAGPPPRPRARRLHGQRRRRQRQAPRPRRPHRRRHLRRRRRRGARRRSRPPAAR